MADPLITNVLTPKVADQTQPLSRGEVALKIISTTGDLQSVRRPTQLLGNVTAISKDNTTATIQTQKGDVTVQLRNNTPLQQGQSVEIDVPAGQPPRQAIVRQDPSTPQQLPQNSSPPTEGQTQSPVSTPVTAEPPVQTQQGPLPSTTQPALPPDTRAALDQAAPQPVATPAVQTPAPLPTNAIVRLIPLNGLPATTDLLPVPAAIQALIENIQTQLPGSDPLALLKIAFPTSITPPPVAPANSDLNNFTNPQPKLPGTPIAAAPAPTTNTPAPTPFDVRILSIKKDAAPKFPTLGLPQSAPTPATTPTTQPPLIADVVGLTKNNLPIISVLTPGAKTPQLFTLQFPATNLPVGTQLEIAPPKILPVPGEAQTPPALPPTSPSELLTGWTWPVMSDTMQTLSQTMAQAMANVLPSPAQPAVMNSAVMFFIAAIQSGDIASWLGDKGISALRRDAARGGDILNRLTRDIEGLGRLTETPVSQDWKGIALPLYWQNDIQKMHLFYRHEDNEKEDDAQTGDRSTRFLFDLNLTNMGDVQIDGTMKAKRLDLILRTGTLLSHPMQTAMREKYLSVLETGGLSGDLAFQNRLDQWVRVKVDAKKSGWAGSV